LQFSDAAVVVSGSTLTLMPTLISALEEQSYSIVVPAGFATDAAGNAFAGVAAGEWVVWVVDDTAPQLVATAPSSGSSAVSAAGDVILQFDEPVAKGTGNIVFTSSGGDVVSIDVTGDEVFVVGAIVLIRPDTALTATPGTEGTVYTVTMAAGVLTDDSASTNGYLGLSGTDYTFTVTDISAPVLLSSVPVDSTAVASTSTITLTFDSAVVAGSGFIVVTAMDTKEVQKISVLDTGSVAFSGSVCTVTTTMALVGGVDGQSYMVEMLSGVITDAIGNPYLGLYGAMYSFSIVDTTDPTLASSVPEPGTVDVGFDTS
jgi:methionine-rich copper-binding protein CopC